MSNTPEILQHPGITVIGMMMQEASKNSDNSAKSGKKNQKGATLAWPAGGLQAVMQDKARQHIASFAIERSFFLLNQNQLDHLESILEPAALRLLESLNGLGLSYQDGRYETHDILKTLQTVPASPEGWTDWWLTHKDQHTGMRHPKGENNPEYLVLRQALRQTGAEALPHMPSYVTLATRLKKGTKSTLSLADVFISARKLLKLAAGMLITPEELKAAPPGRPNPDDSPEDVQARLAEAGIPAEKNIGTANTDTATLKRDLNGLHTTDVRTVCMENGKIVWYAKTVKESHVLPVNGDFLHTPEEPEDMGTDSAGKAERKLREITTVDHPLDRFMYERDESAYHLAWALDNSPENVKACLNGKTDEMPEKPADAICPEAHRCQTGCGLFQRAGIALHPLTEDNQHTGCQYWQFLERHKNSPSELRESAAEAEVQRIFKQEKARAKAKEVAPSQQWTDCEEEGGPEPAGTAAARQETAQAALF